MLLKRDTLHGIRDGKVSLAFRCWKRPTVKAGGTLLTAIGQLAVLSVEVVELDSIKPAEARKAGFESLAALREELAKGRGGEVYRIELKLAGPDPRLALRREIPKGADLDGLLKKLDGFDRRSKDGAWTGRVMALIHDRPATRAGDLAEDLGLERDDFKPRVRKLKALGLTESLDVGYRLSPRGVAVLKALRA